MYPKRIAIFKKLLFKKMRQLKQILGKKEITNYQLRIVNYELSITNCQLRIVNYELSITNYQLRIVNYELSITNCELRIKQIFRRPLLSDGWPFRRVLRCV